MQLSPVWQWWHDQRIATFVLLDWTVVVSWHSQYVAVGDDVSDPETWVKMQQHRGAKSHLHGPDKAGVGWWGVVWRSIFDGFSFGVFNLQRRCQSYQQCTVMDLVGRLKMRVERKVRRLDCHMNRVQQERESCQESLLLYQLPRQPFMLTDDLSERHEHSVCIRELQNGSVLCLN